MGILANSTTLGVTGSAIAGHASCNIVKVFKPMLSQNTHTQATTIP